MMSNSLKICVVVAEYYEDIAKNLVKGANFVLDKHKTFKLNKVEPGPFDWDKDFKSALTLERTQIVVPGVFELPGMIARFIDKYHAFITLGCVIKGETPHFDFISSACANSISQLTIKKKFPITFGVLTTNTYKQALKRAQQKGVEIADTTILSINTYQQIKSKKY